MFPTQPANVYDTIKNHYLKQDVDFVWQYFSLSVLVLPLFPTMGVLGLVYVLIRVWLGNYQQIVTNPLNWGWGILSVLLIINSIVAYQPSEAWLGLANFLPFFALFAAVSVLITQARQLRQLAWMLILPSVPIVLLGLGQLFDYWSSPKLVEYIVGWGLIPEGQPAGRMSSVFIYANFLAIYLAIAFTLTLGLWSATWQGWRPKMRRQSSWLLLGLSLILLIDGMGLILTSSRNAWGLAFFSFIAFAIYLGWRWLVGGITAATTAIFWASFAPNLGGKQLRHVVPTFLWARLSDQMYPDRPLETLRLTQWQFCLDLIRDRPWLGWGLRNFTPLYESQMNIWFGHPHNLFLMLAAETGIIATFLFMAIAGWIMAQAVILFQQWNSVNTIPPGDRLMLFTYIVAFSNCILFNLLDVTVFDLRINTIGWLLFAAIAGVVFQNFNLDKN